jgi:hypothetical protein
VESSTPIRSSTTIFLAWTMTRCAAASRRVTSRWRGDGAPAGDACRRSRSACCRGPARRSCKGLRTARSLRRARHGRRAGGRPRSVGATLARRT